jgi:hypothetical protein
MERINHRVHKKLLGLGRKKPIPVSSLREGDFDINI